jgi:hypothetical protein
MTNPFRVEAKGLLRAVQVKILLPECFFRMRVWIALRYRKIRYGYAFRRIPLTRGKYAIVDPERYEELAKYKWYATRNKKGIYAVRMVKAKKGSRVRQKVVRMHRVVLKPPEGKFIDHINHNGLDNRIANLRVATPQQNLWNTRKRKCNCSSKYKGVSRSKSKKKWRARINFNGRGIFIGYFDIESAAAMAYDAKAKELFGEYAAPKLKGN